ncbi:MAG: acyl-CoA dehydrogenase [Candidatus Thermoplasmatota archaeon]|nr:acyl-CoA dehydrogenase [Candidatus Thermoplasmatota archaeon]
MNFELTDNQKMVRNMVRDFAENEIEPVADELDEEREYPHEILDKMSDLGLLGIMIPEEYDGAGMDTVSFAIVIEEISRKCAATGVITEVHNSLVASPIMHYGTEEQKEKYLPMLASGEKIGAFGGTEPDAGTNLGAMQTTAEKDGDKYIINGQKTFITSGSEAGLFLVFAVTDKSKGRNGISAFIVNSDTDGFEVGDVFDKMGIHANKVSELFFEDMEVPEENLLGKEGEGYKIALSALDHGRIGIGAQAVGIAQAAIDESIKYSQQREQFGKSISNFQGIQFKLADMETKTEAARLLVYNAADAADRGERFTKEASMAKLFASEVANEAADEGIQIHGGYGYIEEYKVEQLFRDAKITEIYEGTSEAQKMVIARSLLS